MLLTLVTTVALCVPSPASAQEPPQPPPPTGGDARALLSVAVPPHELPRLTSLGGGRLDLAHYDPRSERAEVIADRADARLLERAQFPFQVVHADLQSWYEDRLQQRTPDGSAYGSWLTPAFGQGSMGGYYTYAEVEQVLDQLSAAFPAIVAPRVSIGTSVEGRDLWMVKVSDNPGVDEPEPEVRLDALHHAREPMSLQATLWFLLYLVEEYQQDTFATYLVNQRELYFVPVVNPDGYVFNESSAPGGGGLWRKNRRDNLDGSHGVDLNRNYPYEWGFDNIGSSPQPFSQTYRGPAAASEPETQAMIAFAGARDFQTALSVHTYGNLWLAPWSYDELAPTNFAEYEEIGLLVTAENAYEHGATWRILYAVNGNAVDYDAGYQSSLTWSPEVGSSLDGFWPPPARIEPLCAENLIAFQRTALAGGAWLRLLDEQRSDLGDGDGYPEPGERFGLQPRLRNSGRAANRGSLELTLTSTSPWIQVIVGGASAGEVQPFSEQTAPTPLQFAIDPNTPLGSVVDYTLHVSYEGMTLGYPSSFTVGQPSVLATYEFEAPGPAGWLVGSPGGATSGIWEFGDPVGTAAAPEDDHTPDGRFCWVTGQGPVGGEPGLNDVDGGRTALWSPAWNLRGILDPRVEFWLWFSNDTGTHPNEDVVEIDVSADGGASWMPARTIGPDRPEASGGWRRYEIALAPLVPLTDEVRLRVVASDLGGGSIVEAALDDIVLRGILDCPTPETLCASNTAELSATGSTSILAADLVLTCAGAAPQQFGFVVFGDSSQSIPLGTSLLCVGPPLWRLPAVQLDSLGGASQPFANRVLPKGSPLFEAGDTWYAQFGYRAGAGVFELSNGLRITFCP